MSEIFGRPDDRGGPEAIECPFFSLLDRKSVDRVDFPDRLREVEE